MKKLTRKSFLFAGLTVSALVAFAKWGKQAEQPKSSAKFLTQDGRLVEIDADKVSAAKRTASNIEIQFWINGK